MEKLVEQFSVGLFFWHTLLFLGLMFLLRKFAWKPILNSVTEREESIREALNSAEKAKAELVALESKNDELLKEARLGRDAMLKAARETREKIVSEAKGLAKTEGDKMIAQAREAIENEKAAALEELKSQVSSLAIQVAEKVLRKELGDAKRQNELVSTLTEEINFN